MTFDTFFKDKCSVGGFIESHKGLIRMKRFRFKREGQKIKTIGATWGYGIGNTIQLKYEKGSYHIWYKPGSQDFECRGRSGYFPAQYMLVKIEGEYGQIIKTIEPGRQWRKCLDQLIEEVNDQV